MWSLLASLMDPYNTCCRYQEHTTDLKVVTICLLYDQSIAERGIHFLIECIDPSIMVEPNQINQHFSCSSGLGYKHNLLPLFMAAE